MWLVECCCIPPTTFVIITNQKCQLYPFWNSIAVFFAVDFHPVAGDADKDKHIHAAEVHPHPVRDYAAQSVEPQTHVYGTVVEPVAVTIVKAEHSCEIRS